MGLLFRLLVSTLLFGALLFMGVAFLIGMIYKRKAALEAAKWTCFGTVIFFGIVFLANWLIWFFTAKSNVERNDIYGNYVIDRSKYPGADADWQYEHYRFEITRQDSFLFHVTDGQRIVRTYRGKVEFLPQYKARIVIRMDGTAHHIIEEKPTLYRETFLFYYVFHSPHYHNVFFKKGHYKPIN